MVRYEKGRKGQTRRRIVELASRRFRAEGVEGVGVASLMADAGLTVGGFYAHFASKEELVEEAVLLALSETPSRPECKVDDDTYDLPAHVEEAERRPRAFAVLSHLIGTIQMARLIRDDAMSRDILGRARKDAMQLAGFDERPRARRTRKAAPFGYGDS